MSTIPAHTGDPFQTKLRWQPERPRVLVVACSDGRLQENLDDFLTGALGIRHYDRLYAPGGPGALSSSGIEFFRSDVFRRECLFLVEAHDVEEVILIFHGPAPDGPPEAVCADYRRVFPRATPDEIARQQEADARRLVGDGFGWGRDVHVTVYRCEVGVGGVIRFVAL